MTMVLAGLRREFVVAPPNHTDVVVLPDGRQVEYAEFGDPDGDVAVWLHGTPGSCRQVAPAAKEAAVRAGLRIVGIARPGVGRSTAHRHPRVMDVARDLLAVVDHLGARRFGIVGLSGGGPYALALAHLAPGRAAGVAVLGGVPPLEGPEASTGGLVSLMPRLRWLTARGGPSFAWLATRVLRPLTPYGDPIYEAFSRLMPPADRAVFATPGVKDMFIDDLARGIHGEGLRAALHDALLFGREWGFHLRELAVPVHWWHGDEDSIVGLDHGRHATGLLPDATFEVVPGGSHLTGYAAADDVIDRVRAFLDR